MEELLEDIEIVKDIIQVMLKAKKTLKIYPSNNPIYVKAAEESFQKFNQFLELNNELPLSFRQSEILYNNQQVYFNSQKDENLALFFFKDGIKEVTFLNGLTHKEYENFIKIINTDFENVALDDDVVTLLWEHDFEHIKYVVDEEILSDDEEESRENICEKVKNDIYTDDDLEKAYRDGCNATEKEESNLVPISEHELKLIISEIQKEETYSKVDKVIIILAELIYHTKEKNLFNDIVGFTEHAITYCIKCGDFKRASTIINTIKDITKDKNLGDDNIKTLKRIFSTISSEPYIQEIGIILDGETTIENADLMSYIRHLNITSMPVFITLMGELQSIRGRRLIIDILAVIGKLDMEALAKGLYDSRWYVVRNIITILGKIADARAVEYLTKPLSHPDQRVRKEAIKTLGSIGTSNILPHIKTVLSDEDPSLRIYAARILGTIKNDAAKKILLSENSKKEFIDKDFTEKKEFFEALAHWQDQDVKDFLLGTLNKSKFWRRKKNNETRACAAYAIGVIGFKEALPYLNKTRTNKNKTLRSFSIAAINQLNNQDATTR